MSVVCPLHFWLASYGHGPVSNIILFISVLDIELVADRPVIGLGYSVFLTCNIIRGNPTNFRFTFRKGIVSLPINEDDTVNSHAIVVDTPDKFDIYSCEVSNGRLNVLSTVTITREDGSKWAVFRRVFWNWVLCYMCMYSDMTQGTFNQLPNFSISKMGGKKLYYFYKVKVKGSLKLSQRIYFFMYCA